VGGREGAQLLRLDPRLYVAADTPPWLRRRRKTRATGLALTPHGDLLLGTRAALLRFLCSAPWTPETHMEWSKRIHAKTRELLLCAHRQPPSGAVAGPAALPQQALQHIIKQMTLRGKFGPGMIDSGRAYRNLPPDEQVWWTSLWGPPGMDTSAEKDVLWAPTVLPHEAQQQQQQQAGDVATRR
jgi:hypothetical protein